VSFAEGAVLAKVKGCTPNTTLLFVLGIG